MKYVAMLFFVISCAISSFADEMQEMVEADWLREAERMGEDIAHPEVIRLLFVKAENVMNSWAEMPEMSEIAAEREALAELQAREMPKDAEGRKALYLEIRHVLRRIVLANPALKDRPIAFVKQRRAIQQMFHEYSGYYYNWFDLAGGGVFILENPGKSLETRELTAGMPRGNFASPCLSWDGRTIYFAFCEVVEGERPWKTGRFDPDQLANPPESAPFRFSYFNTDRCAFHLFAVDIDSCENQYERNLRQITFGMADDVDPCELPDGRLAFMSTRRAGYIRCNSGYEPIETSTLHVVNPDGTALTQLSYHETDEWHPSVRPDGKILYTRWDYVDRDATLFHGIWTCNPDGTAPTHLFGSYTNRINANYQPRSIPNSNKIVYVAGAHHADVGGTLMILDPDKLERDPQTGEDSLAAVECITPEIGFSEVAGYWAPAYYSCPLPLSENHFLVAFSYEPLPGMGPRQYDDSRSGIYYLDRFGNRELLYRDPEISSVAPMLLNTPEDVPFAQKPPVAASVLDPTLAAAQQGEFYLTDVYRSQLPFPKDRPVKALRIFELLPKTETCQGNDPATGHAFTAPARAYLGEVPVEEDGSAYFRAPARRPLYFQALDAEGNAIQGMRSNAYLQPGEKRACIGCHEPIQHATPFQTPTLALKRAPSRIIPHDAPAGPLGFPALVQPILDAKCVSCHGSNQDENQNFAPDLRNLPDPGSDYSVSYVNLKPYLRWYEWGKNSISLITSRPGQCGGDMSPLTHILRDETHRDLLPVGTSEYRTLMIWLDNNVPFYGSYHPGLRARQRKGLGR